MKRVVACLLCVIMFLQGSVSGFAAEVNQAEETEMMIDLEIQEEAEALEDSEEIGLSEDNLDPEEHEDLEEQELLEENPGDDPQYGRAHGYYFEEDLIDVPTVYSTGTYTHDSRFDKYTKKDVIDVSSYQKSIDWAKVKASGIDYAMIRVGFRGWGKEGIFGTDARYKENIQNAIAAGVQVGVYIFSQATTTAEAKEEAEFVLEKIKGYDISLPVVIDFEYASDSSGLHGRLYDAKLSVSEATKICKTFCEKIQAQGYTPMVYANKSMLENNLNAADIAKDYKIWLARYNTAAGYSGEYEFWQYTDEGSVSGINGDVDKNFWYVDPNAWKNPVGQIIEVGNTYAKRLYGSDRYVTSFEIANSLQSELGGTKFSHIIVATGTTFADALTGSYLAGIKNAPIIMTNGKNAQDVRNYIQNHVQKGGTVYILGGTAAVPEGVGCGLGDYTVKRLQGNTRYETNLAILKEAKISTKEILVCTGKSFADSLSGSATGKPILLVNKTLTNEQKSWLSSLSGKKFYILGGTEAVSTSLENELKAYGTVERIGGATRYETSVMIAEKFFDSPSFVVMASSTVFADGLCGGVLALKKKAPLILTKEGYESPAKAYARKYGIREGLILGGNNAKLVTNRATGTILGWIS